MFWISITVQCNSFSFSFFENYGVRCRPNCKRTSDRIRSFRIQLNVDGPAGSLFDELVSHHSVSSIEWRQVRGHPTGAEYRSIPAWNPRNLQIMMGYYCKACRHFIISDDYDPTRDPSRSLGSFVNHSFLSTTRLLTNSKSSSIITTHNFFFRHRDEGRADMIS
jgi:hypothetical protein